MHTSDSKRCDYTSELVTPALRHNGVFYSLTTGEWAADWLLGVSLQKEAR